MSTSSENVVLKVVERFLEHRRSGRRLSIDNVLDEFADLPDRAETRKASLHALVRAQQKKLSPTGSSEHVSTTVSIAPPEVETPTIEAYDVIEELGRGGMGAVYEAYQQSTGRRVAVKLMLPSAAQSPTARRRFEREVDLIARLEHPNIVSVIDSGVHRDHYFYAMDYIEGRPLDKALAPGECDAREAMTLMVKISRALDYAHQRGVLHRDLKPTNIIVDARGEPHILDFGLATAFDPESARPYQASISEAGQILGTLAYMAPEQARGQIHLISTRSDVYSLGAIAYELVSGKLPCSIFGPLSEVLTRVEQEDPRPPSSLKNRRDRDLDAVLLKTLEKLPAARYATAGELAADLDRYLAHRPVMARRVGPVGRTARWVRRHRAVSILGGVACLLLITATGIYIRGQTEARERAEAEALRTRRDAAFTQATLKKFQLSKARGADVRLRESFDDAEKRIQAAFPDDSESQALQHQKFGELWTDWSNYESGRRHFERALELRTARYGESGSQVAESMLGLGYCLKMQTHFEEAESYYRKALQLSLNAGDLSLVANIHNYLGKLLADRHRPEEAALCYEKALSLRRNLPPDIENEREIANVEYHQAIMWMDQGDLPRAEARLRSMIPVYERLYADSEELDVKRSQCQTTLAIMLANQEKYPEAEQLARDALDTRLKIYPPNEFPEGHYAIAESDMVLGKILLGRGAFPEAEQKLRDSIRICDLQFKDAVRLPSMRGMLGECLVRQGRYSDAEPVLLQAYQALKQRNGDADADTRQARAKLSDLYQAWGKPDKLPGETQPASP